MNDYLDQPFGAPRYGYAIQDTDFPDVPALTSPMEPIRTPDFTRTGFTGSNVQSRVVFPSLADRDETYNADMSVRQQMDQLYRQAASAQNPETSGILIDDLNNLRSGYRALKGEGWDSARAAAVANNMYGAFGTYADFANRAKMLSDMADRKGQEIGDVTRHISKMRKAFTAQYLHDCGFKDGAQADQFNMADADDEFAATFDAVRAVEDKFNVDFDDSVFGDVLARVARTSAALSNYGASSRDIGLDRVVEAAMYEVGALKGGTPVMNPISDFIARTSQDRDGITWSNYDLNPQDPRTDASPSKSEGLDYGRPNSAKGQEDDQDFSMSRGIRGAFARHRVRNLRNGAPVDDYGDTSVLRQDLINEMKVNSMTTKGLDDEDFGLLADTIIAKRSRNERVSVTDTLRDMLYAKSPQAISDWDRRQYARTVNGNWGKNAFAKILTQFQGGKMEPGKILENKRTLQDSLATSGMSEDAQKTIMDMVSTHMDGYNLDVAELVKDERESPGKTKPQRFQHRAAQLAQAVQLVSMIDACRQGKVIDDATAKALTESMFDKEDRSKLNLGVFHTVNAGFGHASRRDTMSNWLLQTDRLFNDVGWFAETKVREMNSDPLERIFRTLNGALMQSNVDGLGDLRRICSKTVEAMNAYRHTYESISKDSNGYLRSSHVFTPDDETATLRDEDDISVGLWFGSEKLSDFMPKWLLGGSDRKDFRDNMKLVNNLMEQIRNEGYVIPGLEREGYTSKFENLDVAARWDSVAKATIRASEALNPSNGTLLYGISPEKAEAWASWSRNQTMDTPSAKHLVDNLANGLFQTFMRDHQGIAITDPRAKSALANLKRMVRDSYIAAKSVGGLDELSGLESHMLETAAQMGTHPSSGRDGWESFTGDFRLAQELSGIFSPLQMAAKQKHDYLQQMEEEQARRTRERIAEARSAEARAEDERAAAERAASQPAQ